MLMAKTFKHRLGESSLQRDSHNTEEVADFVEGKAELSDTAFLL